MKRIYNKHSVKFKGYIYDTERQDKTGKTFNTFDEALDWRRNKEIEHYGCKIIYRDQIRERSV